MSPQILFRVDASLKIGSGHVMRCLTLADELIRRGAYCIFVTRLHVGHLVDVIRARGHEVFALKNNGALNQLQVNQDTYREWLSVDWLTDAEQTKNAIQARVFDWLIVDHYALDSQWETALRDHAKKIFVIDDLANRKHNCDVVLDQNLGRESVDYDAWLKPQVKRLVGPGYALLRPEFAQWRDMSLARRKGNPMLKLLVSMGGVDQDNITGKVLHAIDHLDMPIGIHIDVVLGVSAPWVEEVKKQAIGMRYATTVHENISNMAELMAKSDLAIGAAGSTSWERCALGLPAILFLLADNQREVLKALEISGAAKVASVKTFTNMTAFGKLLLGVRENLKLMSENSASICDGLGAGRVAEMLLGER